MAAEQVGNQRVRRARSLLDAGSTGTDDGPAGIPANMAGVDRDGDEVPPPPTARPGGVSGSTGPAEGDLASTGDTSNAMQTSSGRGETAASGELPAERGGR